MLVESLRATPCFSRGSRRRYRPIARDLFFSESLRARAALTPAIGASDIGSITIAGEEFLADRADRTEGRAKRHSGLGEKPWRHRFNQALCSTCTQHVQVFGPTRRH